MQVSAFSCLLGGTWPIGSDLLSLGLRAWGHSCSSLVCPFPNTSLMNQTKPFLRTPLRPEEPSLCSFQCFSKGLIFSLLCLTLLGFILSTELFSETPTLDPSLQNSRGPVSCILCGRRPSSVPIMDPLTLRTFSFPLPPLPLLPAFPKAQEGTRCFRSSGSHCSWFRCGTLHLLTVGRAVS